MLMDYCMYSMGKNYLRVTIIAGTFFCEFASFARSNISDSYVEMVKGRHFLMFGSTYS